MKKYFIFLLCLVLSVGIITGCGSKKKEEVIGPKIIADDVKIYLGAKFNPYDYVTVDEDVELEIVDNSVDEQKPGEYEVTYKATDKNNITSKKTIKITIEELDQKKLKEEIEKLLLNLNIKIHSLDSNIGGGYNIISSQCLNKKISDYQTISMYNVIYVTEDWNYKYSKTCNNCHAYSVDDYGFYFKFTDKNENHSDRVVPYSTNKSMSITNGDKTIVIQNSVMSPGMADGISYNERAQFEDAYYIKHFSYDMDLSEIEILKEILTSSNVKVVINFYDKIRPDKYRPTYTEDIPYTFEFELSEEDIISLKNNIKIYEELVKIIG